VNYKADAAGKPIALTDAQLKQIENLTREAMGYSDKRGDSLNVVNSPFTVTEDTSDDVPFWKQPAFIDQMMELGRWLLVLIVAWILYRKLVRPQLRRKAELEKAAVEAAAVAKQAREESGDDAVAVSLSKDEQDQERKSQHRMSAEVMSQRIRDMSENDPRVVALVIRQWMKDEL
jgi:flagellar M-ring protein FliF